MFNRDWLKGLEAKLSIKWCAHFASTTQIIAQKTQLYVSKMERVKRVKITVAFFESL